MNDIDKLQDMRPDLVKRFRHVIKENTDQLHSAMKSGNLNAIAWLTRNLLELAIWSSYCLRSETNAKQFVLDSSRDAHDAINVPDGIFSETLSFREIRAQSIESARQDGFETLDQDYKAVSAAAKEIGMSQEFRDFNKLLSKFAHPTALSVIFDHEETLAKLREKFFTFGLNIASQSLRTLDEQTF